MSLSRSCHVLVFKHIILPGQNSALTPALAVLLLQPPLPRCVVSAPEPSPLGKGEQEPFASSLWQLQWQNSLQFQLGQQAELLPCSFRLLERLCDLTPPLHEGFAAKS